MSFRKHSQKHGAEEQPDPIIKAEIEKRGKNNTLACAVAFKIADELSVTPAEVGKTADLIDFELIKCQLGLFGYGPGKKIVKPKEDVQQELVTAISEALVDGRLPCKTAWEIASRFNVPKMTVSGVCEKMKIKVKPCQLGAF
ncbi:MAG: hypothetical protein JRH18_04775 [Deltaproteobacteria bacterium]|nr:hypothetical protein [Deltaproteobacteria bacterium]MBW1962783.1 hypothetical protein [Deltaproteobacteria bacterium]MBW2150958.1 hypothetical protein [Deltaproteobacteria bacterium]